MTNLEFSFQTHDGDQALIIRFNLERFDSTSVARFKESLDEAWRRPFERVVLDFTRVTFIDSSGVGALLGIQKRMPTGAEPISILHAGPTVVSIIELLRLHRVFTLSKAENAVA